MSGKAKIGVRIGPVVNKYKVAKHFELTVEDRSFGFKILNEKVAAEAALDGIYVIRTNVPKKQLGTADAVRSYKGLCEVERTFRSLKMSLARGVGFDLCPRLKALKDRHLFLPRGSEVPAILSSVCHAHLDPAKIQAQWDRMVHLFASVHSGHTSAINALTRFDSAARGDPLYEALVQLGQLLRTVSLADYFVNEPFRRELLRVLNRGESANALKRAIYAGRVAS